MSLENPTKENLALLLNDLADRLSVVNRSIMDAEDYDLTKYEEIKKDKRRFYLKGSLLFVNNLSYLKHSLLHVAPPLFSFGLPPNQEHYY